MDRKSIFRTWINEKYDKWTPPEGYNKNRRNFARWIGVSNSAATRWLSDGIYPIHDNRHKLYEKFGVEAEKFFDIDKPNNTSQGKFQELNKRKWNYRGSSPKDKVILNIDELSESYINYNFAVWFWNQYQLWEPAAGLKKSIIGFIRWLGLKRWAVRGWFKEGAQPSQRSLEILENKLQIKVPDNCVDQRFNENLSECKAPFSVWMLDQYKLWKPEMGELKTLASFSRWLGFSRNSVKYWLTKGAMPKITTRVALEKKFGQEATYLLSNHNWYTEKYKLWVPPSGMQKTSHNFADWLGVSPFVLYGWFTSKELPTTRSVDIMAAKFMPTTEKTTYFQRWFNEKYAQWCEQQDTFGHINLFSEEIGFSKSLVLSWLSGSAIPSPQSTRTLVDLYGKEVLVVINEQKQNKIDTPFQKWLKQKYADWEPDGVNKTKQDFAKWIGVPNQTLVTWMTKNRLPRGRSIYLLADKFGEDTLSYLPPEQNSKLFKLSIDPFPQWLCSKYKKWEKEKGFAPVSSYTKFSEYLGVDHENIASWLAGIGCQTQTAKILVDKLGPYWF